MGGDRFDVVVCGRLIGTADGWDGVDELTHVYYEFRPTEGLNIPDCDLGVVYGGGKFEAYDDDGEVVFTADIIDTIKHLEAVR